MNLRAKPDIAWKLSLCRKAIAFHQATLVNLTEEELAEYAVCRLVRDHYITAPKRLAADVSDYCQKYEQWWERWRDNR